jgi:hypothetical protein
MRSACAAGIAAAVVVSTAVGQSYSGQRLVKEAAYREQLRGMWLGECIANWTGLQTEGRHRAPPFLTDASWGVVQPYSNGFPLEHKWFFNPWWADDDTDIEYVYQHLMVSQDTLFLTPEQIAQGWTLHINRFIWVSNATARGLIGRGVMPPSTGIASANVNRLAIDAQLTTELFGVLAPGMPGRALELADLPIRTSAAGYAVHASQFFVVLYSLASQVPASLSGRDKAVWLVQEGRRYVPDGSRAAEVIDFVLADFLANPDVNDWEATRDRMYVRYVQNPGANGWVYRDWFESAVNLGTGVMALLYGQGDYKKTVQVGTLSGWDSDNGTATMGGLLGLMNGYDWVRAQFNNGPRENFWILRTRDALPDYTGGADAFEDTFAQMADRLMPLVRRSVAEGGGLVGNGLWLIPPVSGDAALAASPTYRLDARSANNRVRRAGGVVTASVVAGGGVGVPPFNRGSGVAGQFTNGLETGFGGEEESDATRTYYSSQGKGTLAGEVWMTVEYDRHVEAHTVRYIGGDVFNDATGVGGWCVSPRVEVRVGGVWEPATGAWDQAVVPTRPFQMMDFVLAAAVQVTGVRVIATAGGSSAFLTCSELDVLSSPPAAAVQSFDCSGDGVVGVDDLYAWEMMRRDLDGDGVIGETDRAYLMRAVRWGE